MPPSKPPIPNDGARSKAVLFCPDCDHESSPDGDWTVSDDGRCRRYDCPNCGATITKRRQQPSLLAP